MRLIFMLISLTVLAQAQFLNQGNMSAFRVGSKIFSHQEIDNLVNQYAAAKNAQSKQPMSPGELHELRLMIVDQMVSMELIKLEAQSMGIKVSPKSVDSLFKLYKSQFPSTKQYNAFLKGNGLTEAGLKSKIQEQILPQRVMDRVLKINKAMPTERETRAFFDANKSKFPVNDSVMAMRIMMKSTGADAKTLLEGFAAQVRLKKAPFQMLAAQFSEDPSAKKTGGMIPPFKRGDFGADCATALKGLSRGEVSRVCVGKGSSNLFMMVSANDGRYESYKDRAMQAIMMERQQSYMTQFKNYASGLRSKYGVQFYDPAYDPSSAGPSAPAGTGLGGSPFKAGGLSIPGVP